MVFRPKESTTRRKFVKEIAGAAVAGALVNIELAPAAQATKNRELLVAPCGLYCGACPMYLDTQSKDDRRTKEMLNQFASRQPGTKPPSIKMEDLQCDGCIAQGRVASFCTKCAIRSCAQSKTKSSRCSECAEFPCARITGFNNDGLQHHSEVLANLRRLQEVGIKEWAKTEEDRWSCPRCHNQISWYEKSCSKCGAPRSDRLFKLKA